jgi:S-DNA-T family DNA segregation ATPase FtsK/SpoIIIE
MQSYSNRKPGFETRSIKWAVRNPVEVGLPLGLAGSTLMFGPTPTGIAVGATSASLLAWYRSHPDSFDRFAAPYLRSLRRRWFSRYSGGRWRDVATSCDLAPAHRKTGEQQVPRVVKVRSSSSSVDTVYVRMVPGQTLAQWQDKTDALAVSLNVERVGVERVKPQILALIVQRRESFTEVIEAPEMLWDSDAVDLSSLFLGETEFGSDWCEPLIGNHWLVAGATGSGKGSLAWGPLRSLAPMIRDGLVRLHTLDPKRMELTKAEGISHAYASDLDDCVEVVRAFVADLRETEESLADQGKRKFTPSQDTPLNLLMMDELGALLSFGDYAVAKELRKLLSIVGTQGRATGHSMLGYVQEPTKDTVPIRDLFTVRICLRVTTAGHADMVLGDGARLRGALADEIPNDPATAGIGYVLRPKSRLPMRVRAAYVDDAEIDELTEFVTTSRPSGGLRVVA